MSYKHEFSERVGNFRVCVRSMSEMTTDEQITLHKAVRHMAQKLGGQEFEDFCTSYSYDIVTTTGRLWWKKTASVRYLGFKYSNGRTREQVYTHLMGGQETLAQPMPTPNNTADIELVIDRGRSWSAIGYTYPNTVKQWIYSWFLKSDYRRVAGNLAHEWCHKMGYGHEYRYNPTRQHTVPYAVGDFVAGIVR